MFGRVNLLDFLLLLMLFGLIPLAYAGFLLFRVPPTVITTISPDRVVQGQESTLALTGQGIRPFLEVRFASPASGLVRSQGLYVESGSRAEVKVPSNLPPGTYDFILMDRGRVVFSKPSALSVVATKGWSAQETTVQARGVLIGLTDAEAAALGVGSNFASGTAPAVAELLARGSASPDSQRVKVAENGFVTIPLPGQVRVPAIIRLRCTLTHAECRMGETPVSQGTLLLLPVAGSQPLKFVIDEVRSADAPPILSRSAGTRAVASVRVRFAAPPEILTVLKAGDVDVTAGTGGMPEGDRAVLTEIGTDRRTVTGDATLSTANVVRRVPQPIQLFTATLSVPATYTASGWAYRDRPLKVGAQFSFETTSGVMTGWIVGVNAGVPR